MSDSVEEYIAIKPDSKHEVRFYGEQRLSMAEAYIKQLRGTVITNCTAYNNLKPNPDLIRTPVNELGKYLPSDPPVFSPDLEKYMIGWVNADASQTHKEVLKFKPGEVKPTDRWDSREPRNGY